MDAKPIDPLLKLLVLGDSGVGKSSLLLRFCDDSFSPSFISTVGIDFKIKTISLPDKRRVKLQIWDTAGQERFRTITSAFYRGAMGIILVYDMTNAASFQAIGETWLPSIDKLANPGATLMLVANKCDLQANRAVTNASAKALASERNMLFETCSAKDSTNVEAAFIKLAEMVLTHTMDPVESVPTLDLQKEGRQSSGCCKE